MIPTQRMLRQSSLRLAPHIFGTDNFGRDVFSRVLSASKYTIFISFAGIAIALVPRSRNRSSGRLLRRLHRQINNALQQQYNVFSRNTSGSCRGCRVRCLDVQRHMGVGTCFRPTFARVCRAGTMEIKERGYILHARVTGVKPVRIMAAHILPNLLPHYCLPQ